MDNDLDREIETIKKLIVSTTDDNLLKYLTKRLNTLLTKKQSQTQQRSTSSCPTQILNTKENKIPVKIVGIRRPLRQSRRS
jgi:hypothetical protein